MKLLKKNWDIFGGSISGMVLSVIASFKLERIQLIYSVVILMLVCIGLFRMLKQSFSSPKREHNIIDNMVDTQKPIKALTFAEEPTKKGEELGEVIIETIRGGRNIMKNLKVFFDKFKGYISTVSLALLTAIEMYGGYINELCDGKLVVEGVEVVPLVTLALTVVVGLLSNTFTKEQWKTIKELFKKVKNNILLNGLKKSIKETKSKLKEENKVLTTLENELSDLNVKLENAKNTLHFKQEMVKLNPPLATNEEVLTATRECDKIKVSISAKSHEIEAKKQSVESLKTKLDDLKNKYKEQLK